jgi:exonuclease VII small subunit
MNAERRDDKVAQDDDPVDQLSYMAASRELDDIVGFFERSEVDVDQLVARLERATAIVDELDRRIRRTRAQVEELVPKLEAAGRSAVSGEPDGAGAPGAGNDGADDALSAIDLDEEVDGETLPF